PGQLPRQLGGAQPPPRQQGRQLREAAQGRVGRVLRGQRRAPRGIQGQARHQEVTPATKDAAPRPGLAGRGAASLENGLTLCPLTLMQCADSRPPASSAPPRPPSNYGCTRCWPTRNCGWGASPSNTRCPAAVV